MDFWESMSNSAWGDLSFEASLHHRSTIDLTTKNTADSWNLSSHHPDETQIGVVGKGGRAADDGISVVSPEKRRGRRKGMTRPKSERHLNSSSLGARSSSMERKQGTKDHSFQRLDGENEEEKVQAVPHPEALLNKSRSGSRSIVPELASVLSQLEQENLIRLSKEKDDKSGSCKPLPRRHRSEQMISKTLSRRELMVGENGRSSSRDRTSAARRYKSDSAAQLGVIPSVSTVRKDIKSHSVSPAVRQRKSRSSSIKGTRTFNNRELPCSRKLTMLTTNTNVAPSPSHDARKSSIDFPSNPCASRTSRSPMRPRKPSSLHSLQDRPSKRGKASRGAEAYQPRSNSWDNVRSRRPRSSISTGQCEPSGPPKLDIHQRRSPSPGFRRHVSRRSASPGTKASRAKSNRSLNASSGKLLDNKQALERGKFSLPQISSDSRVPQLKKIRSMDAISRCKVRRPYVPPGMNGTSRAHTVKDADVMELSLSSLFDRPLMAQPTSKSRSFEAQASQEALHFSFAESLRFSMSHQASLFG
jgi:hypothetical protein